MKQIENSTDGCIFQLILDIFTIFDKILFCVESNSDTQEFCESAINYVDRKIQNLTEKEIKKLDGFDKTLTEVLSNYL